MPLRHVRASLPLSLFFSLSPSAYSPERSVNVYYFSFDREKKKKGRESGILAFFFFVVGFLVGAGGWDWRGLKVRGFLLDGE